jgi:hypothetical protein
MSKLYKLKKWLTLQEAVNHISGTLSEPISEADFYRLALDRHITLSVNFVNGAEAYLGKLAEIEDIDFKMALKVWLGETREFPIEDLIKSYGDKFPLFDTDIEVKHIFGVWDLTLLGSEAIDLEYYYQQLTSGLEVTLEGLEGVLVEQDGVLAKLLTDFDNNEYQKGSKAYCEVVERSIDTQNFSDEEVENIRRGYKEERLKYLDSRKGESQENLYYPSGGLDEHDYVFVIRTLELNRFLRALDDSGNLDTVTKTTDSQITFSEKITQTSTWQELYNLAEKALEEFPRWQQLQPKPQNIPKSHIDDWLMETLKATKREAETIKKIITEIFNL